MGIINVTLIDETGNEEAAVAGDTHLLDSLLPGFQNADYQCLRYIDPYGDTVFNRLQMKRLAVEWGAVEKEAAASPPLRLVAQRVRDLITRGSSEPHLYLKFSGD